MKYFTIDELCRSATATAHGIKNTPGPEERQNLIALVGAVLDPVRERWGRPITVSSGFRSPALNRAVGGVATSQHTKGEAADIAAENPRETARLGRLIAQMGAFDQLIFEQSDGACTQCQWIHVSWKRIGFNRRQTLKKPRGSNGYQHAIV